MTSTATRMQTTSTAKAEETPEQVLARLERYAASIGIAAPRPRSAPVPVATSVELRHIGFEAMGYVVGLACCVVAIFAFQRLDHLIATAIIGGFVLGGALATTRRFPLALWWTLGFAIGGVLAALVVTRDNSLFRHRDFLHLWCAESVSQLGSQVSLIALPLVAITVLHATTFEVGALDRRGDVAVRARRVAGRRDRRSPAAPAGARVVRHRARARARVDPDRVRVRRADVRAAARRRVRHRHADGVLRRRVPVDPPRARRARTDRRRQRQARDQPVGRAARGPGHRRTARAMDRRRERGHRRRRELRRVGRCSSAASAPKSRRSTSRVERRSRSPARARPRDPRRPRVRAAAPGAAYDRGQHRDLELLQLDDDGGVPALRGARADYSAGRGRPGVLPRQRRCARRRADGRAPHEQDPARPAIMARHVRQPARDARDRARADAARAPVSSSSRGWASASAARSTTSTR